MTVAIDGYDTEKMEMALVDIIGKALVRYRAYSSCNIKKVSYDGDHNSCEIIITLRVGDCEEDFVISSDSIKIVPSDGG